MKFIRTWFAVTTILLFTVLQMIPSCTKHGSSSSIQYQEGWIRVIGVKGTDTSTTKQTHARTETVGLVVVEDATLKAELMSYTPLPNGMGRYEIRMTNKTSCQRILRWGWEDLAPVTSIEPDDATAGTPQADVIQANQVKTYIMIAKAAVGRIKVKAEKSNSDCENSSQLIINITIAILPIEFTNFKVDKRDKDYVVNFSTETPQDVDIFYIMWSPTGKKEDETIRATVDSDHSTKAYKVSFPRIRVETK